MTVSQTRGPTRRSLLLGTGGGLVLLGGCGGEAARTSTSHRESASTRAAVPTPVTTPSPTPVAPSPKPTRPATVTTRPLPAGTPPRGTPTRVVVTTPKGRRLVDAEVVAAGLDGDGILAPPPGVVGWYDEPGWPEPGFPGAAILAGHINTRRYGPDTFATLPQVRPGARIRVRYSSGDEVEFVVTRSAAVPKKQTPKDDTIWDAGNPRPLLRLITCDPATPVRGGHYVGNWVVWADTRT